MRKTAFAVFRVSTRWAAAPTALSLMVGSSSPAAGRPIPRSSEVARSTQPEGWRQAAGIAQDGVSVEMLWAAERRRPWGGSSIPAADRTYPVAQDRDPRERIPIARIPEGWLRSRRD